MFEVDGRGEREKTTGVAVAVTQGRARANVRRAPLHGMRSIDARAAIQANEKAA